MVPFWQCFLLSGWSLSLRSESCSPFLQHLRKTESGHQKTSTNSAFFIRSQVEAANKELESFLESMENTEMPTTYDKINAPEFATMLKKNVKLYNRMRKVLNFK